MPCGRELAHGEVLEDAPLDLVEAEVVLVEDAARLGDVDRLLLGQRPRQLDQPVEIGADHAVFGRPPPACARSRRSSLRACSSTSSGISALAIALLELGHLRALPSSPLAELPLDRRHLLAQQHLALALVERRLGLLADLLRQPQHLDALGQQPRDLVHPRGEVERLEDLLLLLGLDVHVGGDQVGELRGRRRSPGRLPAARAAPAAGAAAPRAPAAAGGGSAPRSRRCAASGSGMRGDARHQERPAARGTRGRGSAARPGRRGGACRRAR